MSIKVTHSHKHFKLNRVTFHFHNHGLLKQSAEGVKQPYIQFLEASQTFFTVLIFHKTVEENQSIACNI